MSFTHCFISASSKYEKFGNGFFKTIPAISVLKQSLFESGSIIKTALKIPLDNVILLFYHHHI